MRAGPASEGSLVLGDAFEDYKQQLDESTVDLSVPWMDPRSKPAQIERNRVVFLFDTLPDIGKLVLDTANQLKAIQTHRRHSFSWVGWLNHTNSGQWQILESTSSEEDGEGDLVVIYKQEPTGQASIIKVGRMDNGAPKLTTMGSQALMTGRPVFLRKTIQSSKAMSK